MANTPISGLTDGVTAQVGDQIPIARSGSNYYITPGYIRTYIFGSSNTFTALVNFQANLTIGQTSVTNGNVRFYNSTNSNYVGLQSGATATSVNYTLPTTLPVSGQILSSDSSGVMSWVNNTAGSVNSGSVGQLPWYAGTGTTLSPNTNLFWDNTNSRFGIGTNTPSQAYEFYKASSSFLYVSGDGATGVVSNRYTNSALPPQFIASKSRGTRDTPLPVQTGDQVLSLLSSVNNGSGGATIAEVATFVDTYTSSTDISSYMTFSTSPSGGTASTERMRLDKSGNLGLGATSPVSLAGYTTLTIDNATNGGLIQLQKAGANFLRIGNPGGTDAMVNANGVGGALQLAISGAAKMTVANSGDVGIGTTTPTNVANYTFLSINNATNGGVLEIQKNSTSIGRLGWDGVGSSNGLLLNANGASGYLSLATGGAVRATLTNSGNLGIGTTSAVNKLDVVGSIGVINGTSYTTTIAPSSSTAANWTLTLPTTGGTNGYVLTTDGNGVTSWAAASGGVTSWSGGTTGLTPASATTGAVSLAGTLAIANGGTNNSSVYPAGSIIYSDGTSLTQNSTKLYWDNTNQSLGVGTNTVPTIAGFTFLTIDNSSGSGILQLNSSGTSIARFGSVTLPSGHTNGLLFNNNVSASSTSGGFQFTVSGDAKLTISNTGTVAVRSGNTSATATNNVILGGSTAGSNATNTLVVNTGTAPTSGPTATVQFYSSDRSTNNTIPSFFTEGSGVTNAGITNTTVTNKIAIRVNGTIYYLLATTNAT